MLWQPCVYEKSVGNDLMPHSSTVHPVWLTRLSSMLNSSVNCLRIGKITEETSECCRAFLSAGPSHDKFHFTSQILRPSIALRILRSTCFCFHSFSRHHLQPPHQLWVQYCTCIPSSTTIPTSLLAHIALRLLPPDQVFPSFSDRHFGKALPSSFFSPPIISPSWLGRL